ncbi:MAG TPA: universal stress protein [Pelomicrobium sp.]|nr:universal stress protein [Pelomicrobium sp.]
MKRFKNILAVLANAADATLNARAISLARQNDASLTFAAVVDVPRSGLPFLLGGQHEQRLTEHLVAHAQRRLAAPLAEAREAGVNARGEVLEGTAFLEIIRAVLRDAHDLVMKSADGAAGERTLGSVDLHLLRKCPVPVWIVKPARRSGGQRVLALVDPDPRDAERQGLNTLILQLGWSLAEMQRAELHVGHAWRLLAEDTLRSSGFLQMRPEEVDQLLREERRERRRLVEQLVSATVPASVPCKVHLVKGEPRTSLAALAARHRPDVIVMGTVGRSGIPGLFIGNAAESVLSQVTCSVLAVKPEGFKSPVTL